MGEGSTRASSRVSMASNSSRMSHGAGGVPWRNTTRYEANPCPSIFQRAVGCGRPLQ
jgi:hypothetical protein